MDGACVTVRGKEIICLTHPNRPRSEGLKPHDPLISYLTLGALLSLV